MKKIDKLDLLHNSIGTYNICKCCFYYDTHYYYYYVLDVSDKLFLGANEDDFLIDGFQVRKISDLKKIELNDNLCSKINQEHRILADVNKPEINLSSWKTVFESLKPLNVFVIVENETAIKHEDFFYIGRILEVKKSYVIFSPFDADGIWSEDVEIPYSKITSIMFNDRYSKTWQEYFSENK